MYYKIEVVYLSVHHYLEVLYEEVDPLISLHSLPQGWVELGQEGVHLAREPHDNHLH